MRTSLTCNLRDINVIYYLKCNMCGHKETYIGKTVGDNVVGFKSRMNQHISDCRTGTSTCKFPINVYHCAMKNKCLEEPYFQLILMMKLKDSREVKFYENHFDKNVFDTINCPEYLKKHLNLFKLSLFSKRYKFVFYCRKIKLCRANAKISSVKN